MDDSVFETQRDGYVVSTDRGRLDLPAIHRFLSTSYWSPGLPFDVLEKSIYHSLPFGLYCGGEQAGFARVITDRATFAYLCDVYLLESHRGHGLGTWFMETVVSHPDLQGLRRFVLITRDAHRLYERVGFRPLAEAQRYMEIHWRNVYESASSESRRPGAD